METFTISAELVIDPNKLRAHGIDPKQMGYSPESLRADLENKIIQTLRDFGGDIYVGSVAFVTIDE